MVELVCLADITPASVAQLLSSESPSHATALAARVWAGSVPPVPTILDAVDRWRPPLTVPLLSMVRAAATRVAPLAAEDEADTVPDPAQQLQELLCSRRAGTPSQLLTELARRATTAGLALERARAFSALRLVRGRRV